MPPKKSVQASGAAGSKKTQEKKKEKIIEVKCQDIRVKLTLASCYATTAS